jgi:hypothetical protein
MGSDLRVVLTVLLLLATAPAWAEWLRVGKGDDVAVTLDTATLRKDGNLRRVWEQHDYQNTVRGKFGERSLVALAEYDCNEGRRRTHTTSAYSKPMATGHVVYTQNSPSGWEPAAPGTVGAEVLKYVCSH